TKSNDSHDRHKKSGSHGDKANKHDNKSDKHGGKADKSSEDQYFLAVMDYKGENSDQLSVKIGDMVKQLDSDATGWVWAEKVAGGEDGKAEAGYVPSFAIKAIPAGSGKDTAKLLAEQSNSTKKQKQKKHGKHDD
ncbi:unnamed protein product, partial [Prorocentrum cordatum]